MFETIKGLYDNGNGLWSLKRVWDVVGKAAITPEEYEEITGKEYSVFGAGV